MQATYASNGYADARDADGRDARLEGVFEIDPHAQPITSSGKKQIWRGRYRGRDGEDVAACALVFQEGATAAFGVECANLGKCSTIGVGPRLLDILEARVGDDPRPHPIIIEEDAGESLARLFRHPAMTPLGPILHAVGSPERTVENMKVTFDVFSQVMNAHRENLYHCDLRCENVCVKRFGSRPEDIRATIIDVDLGAARGAGSPRRRASLFDTLFRAVPTLLSGGTPGTTTEAVVVPGPLEMDLGYLAALMFHLDRGDTALNDRHPDPRVLTEFLAFVDRATPFFGYVAHPADLSIRHLDEDSDLRPVARRLGLREVCEQSFPTEAELRQARTYNRLFLDAQDLRSFESSAVARMPRLIDDLAHAQFERYKALRRAQGRPVEYETLESQPEDLRRSCYDQMAHVLTKVAALGLETVPMQACDPASRVCELSEEQVEILARMEHARWVKERLSRGWTLGERCPEAKTSPYLVPYDQVPDEVREYDRDAARSVIPLLEMVGIAVVDPTRSVEADGRL